MVRGLPSPSFGTFEPSAPSAALPLSGGPPSVGRREGGKASGKSNRNHLHFLGNSDATTNGTSNENPSRKKTADATPTHGDDSVTHVHSTTDKVENGQGRKGLGVGVLQQATVSCSDGKAVDITVMYIAGMIASGVLGVMLGYTFRALFETWKNNQPYTALMR